MSTVDHGGIKYRIPKRKEHRVCDCWSGTDYTVFFLMAILITLSMKVNYFIIKRT